MPKTKKKSDLSDFFWLNFCYLLNHSQVNWNRNRRGTGVPVSQFSPVKYLPVQWFCKQSISQNGNSLHFPKEFCLIRASWQFFWCKSQVFYPTTFFTRFGHCGHTKFGTAAAVFRWPANPQWPIFSILSHAFNNTTKLLNCGVNSCTIQRIL